MPRLLFEKTGNSIWISHLDLMRLFQRAFKRAGLQLTHTQGFNPRPSVSIVLPLSVGISSNCELLDFDLENDVNDWDGVVAGMNAALVDGVRVKQIYSNGRKIKELTLMHSAVVMEYDDGVPNGAVEAITSLLQSQSLYVEKKSKNGLQEVDIKPLIKKTTIQQISERDLCIDLIHCCQNPTLNPMLISNAIKKYIPEFAPSFSNCSRVEIFDSNNVVFR